MSEYSVNAYFLDKKLMEEVIGSKNEILKKNILSSKLLSELSEGFRKKIIKVANLLIDGEKYEKSPEYITFATWVLIDMLAISRPQKPFIGYPFVNLYDFVEIIEKKKKYANLTKVFEAINGINADFKLPIDIKEWAMIPTITFIEEINEKLLSEILKMKDDIENDAKWMDNFDDDPEDILQVLEWLVEAKEKNKSICLVMNGDL